MLIAISQYKKPLVELDIHRPAHLEFLEQFIKQNKLVVSGRQNPPVGGVIMVKDLSRDEFAQILADDPFVKTGGVEYKIIEFTPLKFGEGYQEVFS